jgi:hypothetical protein
MADKYKFKQDVGGVEYGNQGNSSVYYRVGDVVYGMQYGDSDLVWVNTSGEFNGQATLGVSESILEKVGDENEITTTNYDIPPEQEQQDEEIGNTTIKEKIENILNKEYTAAAYKLGFIGIITLIAGIIIGKKFKK